MSFFVSAEQAFENPSFNGRIPMDMHELLLKLQTVRAFAENSTQEINRMSELSGPDGLERRLRRLPASSPSDGQMPERRLQNVIVATLLLDCVDGKQTSRTRRRILQHVSPAC